MENKKEFIINVLYYALIIGAVYLFCNYLLGILSPFIIGFLFAYFAIKITKKIFKKDTKLIRIISLILLFVIAGAVISLFAALGINQIIDFIGSIPSLYRQYVEPVLIDLSENSKLIDLPDDVINTLLDSIKGLVSSVSTFIVSAATSVISNSTNILISLLTMLITSFYVVVDYEVIFDYLDSSLGGKAKKMYDEAKDFLLNTVFKVLRSYILIMLLTFVELLIGFFILKINNFALIAMIVAFLDILPVVGVGTVLIPWGIFEFIVGNVPLGIELIVLYLIITIIRNIVEPKIVGGNLDLHPLATLFAMMVGLSLFGILGLFGMPLLLSFLVKKAKKEANN